MVQCKLVGFVKKIFVLALAFFSCNTLKQVSMNNQNNKECINKTTNNKY